jgi:hypothetical protein
MKACPVCLIEHDEEIHQASLRIKEYLRSTIAHIMAPERIESDGGEGDVAA